MKITIQDMMDLDELTLLYKQGYDCAQSIVKVFENELGEDYEAVLKSVSSMGMGLLKGSVCGGLLGALAVIGYKYGTNVPDFSSKGICLLKKEEFFKKFNEKYNHWRDCASRKKHSCKYDSRRMQIFTL